MFLATINILVAAPLHWAALAGDTADAKHASNPAALAAAWSAALRERAFWMLVVTFCTWSLAFGSLTFHLLPLLAERGISDAMGIALLASVGPLQIAGRIGLMLYRGTMQIGRTSCRESVCQYV